MELADSVQFFYLVILCFYSVCACDNLNTLSSITVAFRHGDKTPQLYPTPFYPNDPYKNYPMEPMGYGGLTNQGKRRGYQVGFELRKRYDTFLDDNYKSRDVSVISTNTERTKMTLSLVLAGLYPPKGKQVWNSNFNWQPIPIYSVPETVEGLINAEECPTFQNEVKAVIASKDYQTKLSDFYGLMKNLTKLTGLEINGTSAVSFLFHTLVSESAMKFDLPKWTKLYFPDGFMKNIILFDYKTRSYTKKLKKLNGGLLLRKFLNNILIGGRINGTKVNLYSVHEIQIVALLQVLNLWKNEIPEYGSAVIFELHQCDGKPYIKIVYYKGIPPIFETKIIPGCSEYCPLEDFLNIFKDVIPDDVVETCYGPPNNSLLIPKSANPVDWIYEKLRKWYNV